MGPQRGGGNSSADRREVLAFPYCCCCCCFLCGGGDGEGGGAVHHCVCGHHHALDPISFHLFTLFSLSTPSTSSTFVFLFFFFSIVWHASRSSDDSICVCTSVRSRLAERLAGRRSGTGGGGCIAALVGEGLVTPFSPHRDIAGGESSCSANHVSSRRKRDS